MKKQTYKISPQPLDDLKMTATVFLLFFLGFIAAVLVGFITAEEFCPAWDMELKCEQYMEIKAFLSATAVFFSFFLWRPLLLNAQQSTMKAPLHLAQRFVWIISVLGSIAWLVWFLDLYFLRA